MVQLAGEKLERRWKEEKTREEERLTIVQQQFACVLGKYRVSDTTTPGGGGGLSGGVCVLPSQYQARYRSRPIGGSLPSDLLPIWLVVLWANQLGPALRASSPSLSLSQSFLLLFFLVILALSLLLPGRGIPTIRVSLLFRSWLSFFYPFVCLFCTGCDSLPCFI